MTGSSDVPTEGRVVRGAVELPMDTRGERAANVVIQVEDVSRMDVASTVVGEQRMEDVPLDASDIPFEVEVPAGLIDERGTYSVRVHVDLSGSGRVEPGDLITVQSYPVLTAGSPDTARVAVRRI